MPYLWHHATTICHRRPRYGSFVVPQYHGAMAVAIAPWGVQDRERLRRARAANRHSQAECARALRDLGCLGADQTALSRWETGTIRQPRLETVATLRQYASGSDMEPLTPVGPNLSSEQLTASEPFESFVRSITHEPFLGPRQAAYVDAQIERHRSGPPLSDADNAARVDLMRLLGLA